MRVLVLGPSDSALVRVLADAGGEVTTAAGPLDLAMVVRDQPDWIVSYGYRHLVRPGVLGAFPERVLNLHISALPWNRGADPNFWSWLDGTPKGVTLHHMDAGMDTGNIIDQRHVPMGPRETLASSYARLHNAALDLFRDAWPLVRAGDTARSVQPPGGSYHRMRDKAPFAHLLTHGWDTPVAALEACGAAMRQRVRAGGVAAAVSGDT